MSISELYKSMQSIPRVGDPAKSQSTQRNSGIKQGNSEFKTLLDQKVKLSQHAQSRIRSRELKMDNELQAKIAKGVDSAESKGSREALILADDMAVIANVKSRTIITAMDKGDLKERIFTNIDSTVLV